MPGCSICGKKEWLPYTCSYCGGKFCSKHRLPERHSCSSMPTRSPSYPRRVSSRGGRYSYSQSSAPGQREVSRVRKKSPLSRLLIIIFLLVGGAWYYQYTSTHSPSTSPRTSPGPSLPPLKPFVSVDELIGFLDNDDVSDYIYASDFKCGDFAEALVERAHDAGYDLKVYSMFGSELGDFIRYVESLEYVRVKDGVTIITKFSYGLGGGHAVCKTRIGSEIYLIEPQDDMVFEVINDGCDIVYFGEVTK